MALSVVVHGITVKTGPQTSGRQGAADIATDDGSDVIVYTVPTGEMDYAILSISVCNRASVSANNVNIAISDSSTPADSDFIEWNTSLVPNGVLERTQMIANPGDNIIVRWGTPA